MTSTLLPEHELLISGARLAGDSLQVRLLSEYFPDQDRYGKAFNVDMAGCTAAMELTAFLEQSRSRHEYIYVQILERAFSATSEDGEASQCSFTSIAITETDLNELELKALIKELRGWYDKEHAALRQSTTAIAKTRTKVLQQIDRIERKATGHGDSSAGTLYRQQIEFLRKVLADLGK